MTAIAGCLAALSLCLSPPVLALDRSALLNACFLRTYDRTHLAAHPAQRVAAMSIQFQSFENSLLAGVFYKLRYGPKYGFSGDCSEPIEGGFRCDACGTTDSCQGDGESFSILSDGGDTVRLVNETTGLLAENASGGRDRLPPDAEHGVFVLTRGKPEDCAW